MVGSTIWFAKKNKSIYVRLAKILAKFNFKSHFSTPSSDFFFFFFSFFFFFFGVTLFKYYLSIYSILFTNKLDGQDQPPFYLPRLATRCKDLVIWEPNQPPNDHWLLRTCPTTDITRLANNSHPWLTRTIPCSERERGCKNDKIYILVNWCGRNYFWLCTVTWSFF